MLLHNQWISQKDKYLYYAKDNEWMNVKCHNPNCDVSIKEDAKSPPVFPQWPGTAVSAGTSSAEAGLGSGLIVLSAVTGAGHCTRLSRPELATQIYTAMNIGHFWLRLPSVNTMLC